MIRAARAVIDDHGDVAVPFAPSFLVGPDPADAVQPVFPAAQPGDDPLDDGLQCAPRHAQQPRVAAQHAQVQRPPPPPALPGVVEPGLPPHSGQRSRRPESGRNRTTGISDPSGVSSISPSSSTTCSTCSSFFHSFDFRTPSPGCPA
jgi:hypothetical protein